MTPMKIGKRKRVKKLSCVPSHYHICQALTLSQRTARKVQTETLLALHSTQSSHTKTQTSYLTHRSTVIRAQIAQHIAARKAHLAREEEELRRRWTTRQNDIWASVEGGIKWDEQRVQAEMEVERKKKEEVERIQRAEEAKRRLAEEKKRAEEEKKRLEEEQARKEQQREEEERVKQDEIVKARKATEQAEAEQRKALGLTTADEDWHSARSFLKVSFGPTVPLPLQLTNRLPSNSNPAP